ncbi:MAG: FtsQ-type POTRA domain-containing protein, partial [Chloroflexota bacterium]|nr:FtsQ-type POTRA domain-containing protein [Chloroflexota bacterium]
LRSLGRIAAGLLAVIMCAGLVALLNGPWVHVTELAWAGERLTPGDDLARLLEPMRGHNLLSLDTGALAARVERLPAVERAALSAQLPGRLALSVTEKAPSFIWQTRSLRLIGAADGTLIGALPLGERLPPELGKLPFVEDHREAARLTGIGDVVPAPMLETARYLVALDPVLLGSKARRLSIRLDDEYGFIVVSPDPAWQAAFGFYGLEPRDQGQSLQDRIEHQVAAVRTLFASEPETGVSWVDARNPGKVYFRANS